MKKIVALMVLAAMLFTGFAFAEADTGLADAAGRGRLYAELDREANCNTNARLNRLRDRRKKAGERRKDYMALTKLDAIAVDPKLRIAFEGVVQRMTAQEELKRGSALPVAAE